jgi:hypothetical protein
MPLDPKYLREHATRCWTLAAHTDNPLLKNSLLKVAQRNVRLAVGLEEHHQEKWSSVSSHRRCCPTNEVRRASLLHNWATPSALQRQSNHALSFHHGAGLVCP